MTILVRPANFGDCLLYYRWSQEPFVRENSVRSESFTYEQHSDWFHRRLNDPNTVMYVGAIDGMPTDMGQVRYGRAFVGGLDLAADSANVLVHSFAEVAISIDPDYRGHGYATELLKETEAMAGEALSVRTLRALILPTNTPSIKAFTRAGYLLVGTTSRMNKYCWVYERTIDFPPEVEGLWVSGMVAA